MSASGRLAGAFARARSRTGLIPFITAGYPDPDATERLLERFAQAGALAVELGVPYSDPVADGPDIQRSSECALRKGVHLAAVLEQARRFRSANDALPLVLMTYLNPVLAYGVPRFVRDAHAAGIDAALLTDLPADEGAEIWYELEAGGLDAVVLLAPTTAPRRVDALVARARAFIYCLARTGVTGEGGGESGDLVARVGEIRRHTTLPVAVGFGIARPDQARALNGVADAVVVGAAFARTLAAGRDSSDAVDAAGRLADALVAALKG